MNLGEVPDGRVLGKVTEITTFLHKSFGDLSDLTRE
jgi:hypothetical protein